MISSCSTLAAENPSTLSVDFSSPSNAEEKLREILARQSDLEELHIRHICPENAYVMPIFFSESFPRLKKFNISYSYVKNWIKNNSFAENLEELTLRLITIEAGTDFEGFAFLPSLQTLNIRDVYLTNLNFNNLSYLKQLKKLNIYNGVFTKNNKKQMRHTSLPSLQELSCIYSNIHGAPLDSFTPNIKQLTLEGSNITDKDLSKISKLKNIESLDLKLTDINGCNLKRLRNLPCIKNLSLAATDMRRANFGDLPPSLKFLDLSESDLSLTSLMTLFSLTYLDTLDLREIYSTDITPEILQQLQEALPHCKIILLDPISSEEIEFFPDSL